MSKGTVFVVLGALLLILGCCGKPHSDPKSSESSEECQEDNLKIATVMIAVFKDLSTFMDFTLTESEKLFKDVLADASDTGDQTNEEINRTTKVIEAIVDKLEKLKKLEDDRVQERWETAAVILETLEHFDITTQKDPTAEDRIFSDYFEKHGVDALDKELEVKLKEAFIKIERTFESFWNNLSTADQEKLKKFHEWHLKLKEESDNDKKLDMIGNVFTL